MTRFRYNKCTKRFISYNLDLLPCFLWMRVCTYNVNCLRHLKIYTWAQEAFQEEKLFPQKKKKKGEPKKLD